VAAGEGATLAVLERVRHAVAYAKGAEEIADVLVAAGASDMVLASVPAAPLTRSSVRSSSYAGAVSSRASPGRCRRSPSFGSATRRCRCASWP
jgi:hypothetical protein